MNDKIKWITLDDKDVAMRKSFDGWRVVYPIKNKDNTLNWKNILISGSYWNFIKFLAFILFVLLFYYVYAHDTAICRETVKRDIAWFNNLTYNQTHISVQYPEINYSFSLNKSDYDGKK